MNFNTNPNNLRKNTGSALAAFALLVAGSGVANATPFTLGAATGFNAFIFGDMTETNTDAGGRVAVQGNFAPAGNGGFTVASALSDGAGTFDLVVGGNYTNSYTQMNSGDAFVGGNMNWTGPTLAHNAYVNGNFTNSGYGSVGGSVYYYGTYSSTGTLNHSKESSPTASPIDFMSAKTNLLSLSANLAGDTPNGTVANNGYGTYTLTGTSSTLNVFDLTDTNYSNATINVTAPAGSTVIINVPGSSDSFTNGSINFNGVSQSNVVFNFNAATSLSLTGIGFNGTILAPNAAFTGNNGALNGQLIVGSDAGTIELHNVLFNGVLPNDPRSQVSATPEPGTWVLFATGAGLVGLTKRRRSRD